MDDVLAFGRSPRELRVLARELESWIRVTLRLELKSSVTQVYATGSGTPSSVFG
jgi:hypothetical protein